MPLLPFQVTAQNQENVAVSSVTTVKDVINAFPCQVASMGLVMNPLSVNAIKDGTDYSVQNVSNIPFHGSR